MNKIIQLIIFITIFLSGYKIAAQEIIIEELIEGNNTGFVNFNLGNYPDSTLTRQEVSLYGCNTEATTRIPVFNGQKNLAWNTKNQVLPEIPYGYRVKDGKQYYVSKYYMASPPVFHKNGKNDTTQVNIGLVLPDRFTFFGNKPVQVVHLDYEILEPVYLNFIDVNYDYQIDNGTQSCQDMGVSFIPVNIQCQDFKWINKYSTAAIVDGQGASGIGQLRNDSTRNRVFLPSYEIGDEYLNCEVTILDDIILDHEVSFVNEAGEFVKTINLTDFYKRNFKIKKAINLVCKVRTELPEGCKKHRN